MISEITKWIMELMRDYGQIKVATHLDSAETVVSILMLLGMGALFGYLYFTLRRAGNLRISSKS